MSCGKVERDRGALYANHPLFSGSDGTLWTLPRGHKAQGRIYSCKSSETNGGFFRSHKGSYSRIASPFEVHTSLKNGANSLSVIFPTLFILTGRRIIGYIMVSPNLQVCEGGASNDLDLASDHRAVYCSMGMHK